MMLSPEGAPLSRPPLGNGALPLLLSFNLKCLHKHTQACRTLYSGQTVSDGALPPYPLTDADCFVSRRIGRTGRCGKTGIATTFINKNQSESVLLDLKHLLKEAKQRIPPVLTALDDPYENMEKLAAASGQKGCIYCGGLGHRIGDCPKLASQNRETQRKSKDHFGAKGGMGAEM